MSSICDIYLDTKLRETEDRKRGEREDGLEVISFQIDTKMVQCADNYFQTSE